VLVTRGGDANLAASTAEIIRSLQIQFAKKDVLRCLA
jgi:hypothetical protein